MSVLLSSCWSFSTRTILEQRNNSVDDSIWLSKELSRDLLLGEGGHEVASTGDPIME
jgi:hypothetical protein